MSSEVQAKWMNSSALPASAFLPSFERSQYSIALTSWLVSASMALICSASFSENFSTSFLKSEAVLPENPFSSFTPRSAARASSQASSMRTRYLIRACSLKKGRSGSAVLAYRPSSGESAASGEGMPLL